MVAQNDKYGNRGITSWNYYVADHLGSTRKVISTLTRRSLYEVVEE